MSKTGRVWLAVLAISAAGCGGIGQGQLAQRIFRPGPFQYQKQQAVRFDPYNEQDFAHNGNDSVRPRDYYKPIPEPARGRWPEWGAPRFGYW